MDLLKFDFFFSAITGEMIVNPKHGKQYELSFEEVPKFCITSNFTLRNIDPADQRDQLACLRPKMRLFGVNGFTDKMDRHGIIPHFRCVLILTLSDRGQELSHISNAR